MAASAVTVLSPLAEMLIRSYADGFNGSGKPIKGLHTELHRFQAVMQPLWLLRRAASLCSAEDLGASKILTIYSV